MRTLIMMFVFLVAQTSFCLAKTVYPSEESKKILSKGKLVGEWVADGRKAGVFDDAQILYKALLYRDVFYICTMHLNRYEGKYRAILSCYDEEGNQ